VAHPETHHGECRIEQSLAWDLTIIIFCFIKEKALRFNLKFVQIENHIYNMHKLIRRKLEQVVLQHLGVFPAVGVLGPRQSGKSTLVKLLSENITPFVYLDLQNYEDLNKLSDPNLFFETNREAVICLDEIQLVPHLFSVLRSVIDKHRRYGRFILLGSASQELIQKSSETLAGRIGLTELSPFVVNEVDGEPEYSLQRYWLRGGFPESYLSQSDAESALWLDNFLRTYVERDIPQLGFQIPALQLRRLLMMCAHNQGQLLNSSKLGESLGLSHPTVKRYVDLLEQTYILRTLQPYHANVKKRLVKSPKVFVRDTGILHRLLLIPDFNSLLGNPVFGASWEGLVIENVIVNMPGWTPCFYRTSAGDEVDLVLLRGDRKIAIECKASSAPQLTKGWWDAITDINPDKAFVIAPIDGSSYPLTKKVTITGLLEGISMIKQF
jgi:predicted AAA+ superfamily ATPase